MQLTQGSLVQLEIERAGLGLSFSDIRGYAADLDILPIDLCMQRINIVPRAFLLEDWEGPLPLKSSRVMC